MRRSILLLTLLLPIVAAACSDEGDPVAAVQPAAVRILLTDAPSDMLDTAHVWISRVYLQGRGEEEPDTTDAEEGDGNSDDDSDDSGRLDLFNDSEAPLLFDLLELRNGVTADLTGAVEVDPAAWSSLRIVVDSTRVTLAEGYTFEDGSRQAAFRVPSGSSSGIKVRIPEVIAPEPGDTTTVTVDFDVDDNFRIQMAPQSETEVRRIRFLPVLREVSRNR